MTRTNETTLLFTYGTLRREADTAMRKVISREAAYIGEGSYQGELYLAGSHPAVIPSQDQEDQVAGDLFDLSKAPGLLERLDRYEGYDPREPEASLYVRKMGQIQLRDSRQTREAWIYLYNRSLKQARKIPSGDYLAYRKGD